ncbi:MAG: hypothetical protein ACYDDO_11840 [Acidiferrobacterales bacterium]
MARGRKTGGRTSGTPNKLSTNTRENIVEVFTKMGGVEGMAQWASENKSQFYTIYAKLLPIDTRIGNSDWDKPLQVNIVHYGSSSKGESA